MSLKLNLSCGSICVGGQVLKGEAELHFPQVVDDQLEEVHVKFRGSISTRISSQIGNQRVVRHQIVTVIARNTPLWTRSSLSYPPAGSQLLRIPFEFTLPVDAPPSCQYGSYGTHGQIGYFVELVGIRPGLLSRNRRIRIPIPVVPQDPEGELTAASLRVPNLQIPLHAISIEKKMRRGFFGDYASARLEISFPNVPKYPLFTPIPYTIRVITITKSMKKDEVDKNPTKPLFPTPPMRPSEVQFRVRRLIWLQAHFLAEYGEEDVTSLGGLETATSVSASGAPVDVQTKEKVFIPSERDKSTGTWMQETMFRSAYLLTCPPTFQTPTMRIKYNLFLKVVFPGLGNSIAYEIPINITSGLSAAPPSYGMGSEEPPPPTLDLPPSYWGSSDAWGDDEKSGA